jgi:PHD/YefM family antitoxin component YafN of YafNO toxin-antitoxin module
MVSLNENFVIDKKGHKVGVFLDIKTYAHLVEEIEELEDIRAFDEAKAAKDQAIPFEQAIREIERKRKK